MTCPSPFPAPSAALSSVRRWGQRVLAACLLLAGVAGAAAADPASLRAGMIGLDTSHVPAFVKLFNDTKAPADLAGVRIVAAYPGGTEMPASKAVKR